MCYLRITNKTAYEWDEETKEDFMMTIIPQGISTSQGR